ncbi:MAG: ATP-dependent helicase [Leptospirales bacterium]
MIGSPIDGLNAEQKEAVTAPDGPSLVLAGAGSGKTRVLTHRVAYLLHNGVPSHRILVLTFTKKSSRVMQERLSDLLSGPQALLWSGTFHHVGYRLIREFGSRISLSGSPVVIDREDQVELLKSILDKYPEKTRKELPPASTLLNAISLSRNLGVLPENLVFDRFPSLIPFLDEIGNVALEYDKRKNASRLVDFDDLLLLWLKLLESDPQTLTLLRNRFRFILVDEYQDTNPLQANILDLLAEQHRSLFVVGDDSQSIYSFRGAHVENILTFSERYPEARIFRLETNYRSTPPILDLANRIILSNDRRIEKTLRPFLTEEGNLPQCMNLYSDSDQSHFIGSTVSQMIDRGISPGEIAILYRSHYLSLSIQFELARRKIPFSITSGLRFYEQAHIKDVLAHLRLLENPLDPLALPRLLKMIPRVGARSTEKLVNALSDSQDVFQSMTDDLFLKKATPLSREGIRRLGSRLRLLREMYRKGDVPIGLLVMEVLESGYRKDLYDLREDPDDRENDLVAFAEQLGDQTDLAGFLGEITLLENLEEIALSGASEPDRVVLSTIHQSKGLEWDTVFLLSLNEGVFPSEKSISRPSDLEEERRLFYVASTRARRDLYLCVPESAMQRGRSEFLYPSRFLSEIGPEYFREVRYESWNF